MKILVVGLVKNEQLQRLKTEGEKRGHIVEGCYVSELTIYSDKNTFLPSIGNRKLSEYNLLYLWSVGKKRWEWYVTSFYLNQKYQTKIVNNKVVDPNYKLYLSPAMNYYKQFKEKIPHPKSAIIFSHKTIENVIKNFKFPLVVKAGHGRQGRNVFLAKNKDELVKLSRELEESKRAFIIREYIPNDGDIRVFCVGYRAIGAMKRTPNQKGEFRSNISLGGKGERFDLDKNKRVRDIAEKMAELTQTEVAGVDIMIHKETGELYVLEVNPGPQFTGLEKYTGINAAEEIIKYFEHLFLQGSEPVPHNMI